MNYSDKNLRSGNYLNPVHNRPCPDPYVFKHLNEYWCYCTGFWYDGRCFGILHSRDLLHWTELGGAMERLNPEATCYWAPEVIYDNGRFLMYYSVGNEINMQIRVAVAQHPAGPFLDSGRGLTREEFAIDPHVFKDDDGSRYLFYATDFYQHTHIGTGTVYDRMLDAFTLANDPRPVSRARFDWQVYDPQRIEKGGVRWHTVEGPFVIKRKGIYYQMFSGGNWKNNTYGVSYAISDTILRSGEWEQVADGERILPILRTIPGLVIGPGHNSAVRGTDNVEMFCVYHRWADDSSNRVLAIDRLDWAGERMFVAGPSTTPQPAPNPATLTDFFAENREAGLGDNWQCLSGQWSVTDGAAIQASLDANAEARCLFSPSHFIAEVNLRSLSVENRQAEYGIKLIDDEQTLLLFKLSAETNQATIAWRLAAPRSESWVEQGFTLPQGFNLDAYHLLRLEVNEGLVRICLDENLAKWQGKINAQPRSLVLWTQNTRAAFAGFALTEGWQDLFTESYTNPEQLGWQIKPGNSEWRIENQQLCFVGSHTIPSIITKGGLPENYELVVNAKLIGPAQAQVAYGFLPSLKNNFGPLLTVEQLDSGWTLRCDQIAQPCQLALPAGFDPHQYQQFRFRKSGEELTIQLEGLILGTIILSDHANQLGLYASRVTVAFDMVRVTALE
jgi:GH43 family beta-xylosidase